MSGSRAPSIAATSAELLRPTPFGELGRADLEEIWRLFVRRRVAKGAIVFLEGEDGDRFFVVAAGRLKAFRRVPPGRDVTVFTLGAGDFFGFLPLLDGGPYPASVSALAAAELLILFRADFLRFTRENPSFCLALLAHLGRRMRDCLDQVETLGRQGALARTAHALLSLASSDVAHGGPVEVTLPFSQVELAQLLHVTQENLSRALTRLRHEALVERTGPRRFRLPRLDALRKIADAE
jgi:CRP/FNR family transcriptional regulator, dissimilatory nitrate respiration regulator